MSTSMASTDLPIHTFSTPTDFEAFLDRSHLTCPGIWLKLAKKSSSIPSITWDQAVDVALCFGWIDGQRRSLDAVWSLQRCTPRRPKSLWSKRNVDKVARLTDAGRMRPADIAAVDAAKADGRWERAYAGAADMEISDGFATAIAGTEAASKFFDGLNKTERYAVLWRVQTCKLRNRAKTIGTLVELLASGKVPGRADSALKRKKITTSERPKAKAAGSVHSEIRKPFAGLQSQVAQFLKPRRRPQ